MCLADGRIEISFFTNARNIHLNKKEMNYPDHEEDPEYQPDEEVPTFEKLDKRYRFK